MSENDDLGFEIPDDLSGLAGLAPNEQADDGGSGAGRADSLTSAGAASGSAETVSAPDDISALTGGPGAAEPSIALIITQIAGAEPLVAACALAKIPVDAFATEIGAVASCRELTAGGPDRAAAAISELVKDIPIILVERREGQLSASRWQHGKREADLPAGLILDGAPEELEDLLIGGTTIDQIPGVITSVGISRFKAVRQLGALARRAKKSQ